MLWLYSFQCILNAATSPATKVNEETLTYLNQGKSYELRLKKLGDTSHHEGKLFKVSTQILLCWFKQQLYVKGTLNIGVHCM